MSSELLFYSKIFLELSREKSELSGQSKQKECNMFNEPLNNSNTFNF